jgi:hypothetical protein
MTTETQDKKKKLVLPQEARYMMVNFLENENVLNADALDDETILKMYNEIAIKASKKVRSLEVNQETRDLNVYATKNQRATNLNDLDFIARLHKLNVPWIYLHLFKDAHKELSDKQLWEIVNKSGISPFDTVLDTGKLTRMNRSPIKDRMTNAR